jgi:hypothetical protein
MLVAHSTDRHGRHAEAGLANKALIERGELQSV